MTRAVASFAVAGAALLGAVVPASAQTAFAATAMSDFAFRGVSLSRGRADLSLSVDADFAGGGYAGAMATSVDLRGDGPQPALFGHFGQASRITPDLSAEIGVTGAYFSTDRRRNYGELLAGLLGRRWSLRAYLSPSYFGSSVPTVYAEASAVADLPGTWRLEARVGALVPLRGQEPGERRHTQVDARIGVGTEIGPVDLRLAWVAAPRGRSYTSYASYDADGAGPWVLVAKFSF